MQMFLAKIMIGILSILVFSSGTADSATRIMLEKDTSLIPPGCKVARQVLFKGGTEVILNEYGEVIEGTLVPNYTYFFPAGHGYRLFGSEFENVALHHFAISFKGKVIFNEKGEVIKGTLDAYSYHTYMDVAGEYLEFPKGTEIRFHDNGVVASGIMVSDALLRPIGWKILDKGKQAGFIWFKGRSEIELTPKCEVTSGTIAKETKIGNTVYPAGSKLTFSESGEITIAK